MPTAAEPPRGLTQAQPESPRAASAPEKSVAPAIEPTRRLGWLLILVGAVLLLILLLLLFL